MFSLISCLSVCRSVGVMACLFLFSFCVIVWESVSFLVFLFLFVYVDTGLSFGSVLDPVSQEFKEDTPSRLLNVVREKRFRGKRCYI